MTKPKTKVINNKKEIVATLPDIACVSCSSVIEVHFNKLTGIEVAINFASKKAFFVYDQTKWNRDKIVKEMKTIGYKIIDFLVDDQTQHIGHDDQKHNEETQTHSHTTEEHNQHIEEYHHQGHLHNIKLRDLIEVIIGIILLIPLLLIMIPHTPALDPLRNQYAQLSLTTVILFYLGRKFYFGTYRELIKQKWPGMYTLIAFGISTAYIFSIYLMAVNKVDHLFFEVAASIVVIVLFGDLITAFVQTKATNGLESLMSLNRKSVLVVNPDTKQQVWTKIENVQLNDHLIVRKGESIPTDGVLISKSALINEALLTGEAKLVNKATNQEVIGGTINVGDNFEMQATKLGKDTILASIIGAVEHAQAQKPKLQKIADKIAGWFTPTIILVAFLVFVIRYWAFHSSLDISIETAIATLVIACPCALGIATPLAVAVGINKAAKLGIIYNQASAFEKITKIDTICFDKTGTLTTGELVVTKIYGAEDNIKIAVSLEKYSTHPIAKAFINYQSENKIPDITITKIKEEIGIGIQGKWEGKKIIMSSLNKLLSEKMILSQNLVSQDLETSDQSQSVIALAIDNLIVNIFILEDKLQKNAITSIQKLQKKGIQVVLISGDQEIAAASVAKKLNIKEFYSNVKPIDKANIVKKMQAEGKTVAFVGDGVNDIVALQQADLAIAMGSGSDIAKRNGDITVANNNISAIYQAVVLTKKTRNNIWINFAWAFGYNLIIIPLAAVGFIIPTLAALAMALSDLTVVGNSLVFKWRKDKFD